MPRTPRPSAAAPAAPALTVPDLVLLSLLAERPMHGYDLARELDRREARDWAEVSRAHVYYALRKLAAAHVVEPAAGVAAPARGPDRRVYALTTAGRRAYRAALARPDWATRRPAPGFRTWWALAAHATPALRAAQLARRVAFVDAELARERATLAAMADFPGPAAAAGRQIVDLVIRQFETERQWLDEIGGADATGGR